MNTYTSDGKQLPLLSLPQTFTYNADGSLNYAQILYAGSTYRQTYTYTAGNLTGLSEWVKQ